MDSSDGLLLGFVKPPKIKQSQRLDMMKRPKMRVARTQLSRHIEVRKAFIGVTGVEQCLA